MSVNWQMDNENVAYIHDGIIFSCKVMCNHKLRIKWICTRNIKLSEEAQIQKYSCRRFSLKASSSRSSDIISYIGVTSENWKLQEVTFSKVRDIGEWVWKEWKGKVVRMDKWEKNRALIKGGKGRKDRKRGGQGKCMDTWKTYKDW